MTKVILINPPAEQHVYSYSPQVNASDEGIGYKAPLGLLYIATYLKDKLGKDIDSKVIDCPTERLGISKCVKLIIDEKPDIVGISAWSDFWYSAFELGKEIKRILPSCLIVYGGPHIAIYPDMTLNIPHVDAVIVGDGEVPFYRLAKKMIEGDNNRKSEEGLHFKESGINHESLFYIEKNLDHLSIPDRTLVDIKKYNSLLFKGEYSSTMITSRGCPYRCSFCKLNFQKPLCVSAEKIIEEFVYLQDLGIKEVEVYDDTFTWSPARVRAICEGLIKNGVNLRWAIRDRVDRYDYELLKLLKDAGCVRIHYGIESGVQHVLDGMKKKITPEQARTAVLGAKQLGFDVLTYYMFGNLGETVEDMNETIKFALSLPSDYASFSVTIPYPGTALYEDALKQGIISYDYWEAFAKQPTPDFVLPGLIENLCTKEDLFRAQERAMKKFYLRPTYILREIKKVSSFKELARKTKMAFGMLVKH